jgi:hypothetical protein
VEARRVLKGVNHSAGQLLQYGPTGKEEQAQLTIALLKGIQIMTFLKKFLLLAVVTLALGQVAQANTIGKITLADCGIFGAGCPAAIYTFNIGANSATLKINITGPLVGSGSPHLQNNLIGGVDLAFTAVTLSGLTGTTSANLTGTWLFTQDSLGAAGCGPNNSPSLCSRVSVNPGTGGALLTTGHTYSWTWNWTNSLLPGDIRIANEVHVGANYNPSKGLVASAEGVDVPEPTSLLLLGSGLIGLYGVIRKRSV